MLIYRDLDLIQSLLFLLLLFFLKGIKRWSRKRKEKTCRLRANVLEEVRATGVKNSNLQLEISVSHIFPVCEAFRRGYVRPSQWNPHRSGLPTPSPLFINRPSKKQHMWGRILECVTVPTLVQAVVSIPAFRHTVTTTYCTHTRGRGKEGKCANKKIKKTQRNWISQLAAVEIININVIQ